MMNLEALKNELVGREYSVLELSNILQAAGCEDICDKGNIKEILQSGSIIVATDECGEEHIEVFINITIEAGEDESELATYVKVTDIQEF